MFDDNSFTSYFSLVDDVGNKVRGVSFGLGSRYENALKDSEAINPDSFVVHGEVFTVPLPKTTELFLTVDLAAFGDDGEARFKIDASEIDGF